MLKSSEGPDLELHFEHFKQKQETTSLASGKGRRFAQQMILPEWFLKYTSVGLFK